MPTYISPIQEFVTNICNHYDDNNNLIDKIIYIDTINSNKTKYCNMFYKSKKYQRFSVFTDNNIIFLKLFFEDYYKIFPFEDIIILYDFLNNIDAFYDDIIVINHFDIQFDKIIQYIMSQYTDFVKNPDLMWGKDDWHVFHDIASFNMYLVDTLFYIQTINYNEQICEYEFDKLNTEFDFFSVQTEGPTYYLTLHFKQHTIQNTEIFSFENFNLLYAFLKKFTILFTNSK
jgi:hypothetical protein